MYSARVLRSACESGVAATASTVHCVDQGSDAERIRETQMMTVAHGGTNISEQIEERWIGD